MKTIDKTMIRLVCVAALVATTPLWVTQLHGAAMRGNLCAWGTAPNTWTCGAAGTPCTVVAHSADPTCTAACPGYDIQCGCTFGTTGKPITTYTSTTTLLQNVYYAHGTSPGYPFNTGGCNCTFVRWDQQLNLDYYDCLSCTAAGAGVPGTETGNSCTGWELSGG